AFANQNPGWVWHNTGYVAPLSQWTHLAVTYNNGVVNTYANGVLVDTFNGSGSIGDVDTPHNNLFIGYRQSSAVDNQYFQGLIDEVSIYRRPLSAAEIQSIYAVGSEGKVSTGPYSRT